MDKFEDESDVPLVDEVNDIIIKERTLLNLKLLEQKVEAIGWKDKYEDLLTKISNPPNGSSNTKAYEVAAQIEEKDYHSITSILSLIHSLPMSSYKWCLDTRNIVMNDIDLKHISNIRKIHNNRDVNILILNNCGLDDTSGELISSFLYLPGIEAIDLSNNNLGPIFHSEISKVIEKQSLTLQYLLLHANPPLTSLPLDALLNSFTKKLWGITVSLNDINSPLASASDKNKNGTSAEPSSTKRDNNMARLTYKFLKQLINIYDINHESATAKSGAAAQQGKTASVTSRLERGGDRKGSQASAPSAAGINKLSHQALNRMEMVLEGASASKLAVLGITHAALCKESCSLLHKALDLLSSSLTDLDMTYSYIGQRGAQIITSSLSHGQCQLVRLNLLGNALGDRGVNILSKGLKASNTLIYVNLQSNGVTDNALISLKIELQRKQVLQLIDLRGNRDITLDALIRTQQCLEESGSSVKMRCAASPLSKINTNFPVGRSATTKASYGTSRDTHINLDPSVSSVIFSQQSVISVPINWSHRCCTLYEIDSKSIQISMKQYSDPTELHDSDNGKGNKDLGIFHLSWKMCLVDSSMESSTIGSVVYNSIDYTKYQLVWEIHFTSKDGNNRREESSLQCSKKILASSLLPYGAWTQCNATLRCPPIGTKLEIRVLFIHKSTVQRGKNESNPPPGLCVKGYGLVAHPSLHTTEAHEGKGEEYHVIQGGDNGYWSEMCHEVMQLSSDPSKVAVPEGYTLGRKFMWPGPSTMRGAKVTWRSKIIALDAIEVTQVKGVTSAEHVPTWGLAHGQVTYGYVWCITRCRFNVAPMTGDDTNWAIVASGDMSCSISNSSATTKQRQGQAKDSGDGVDPELSRKLLAPWMWLRYEADIPFLAANDCFRLCFKVVTNPDIGDISRYRDKCQVISKDCTVLLPSGALTGKEDAAFTMSPLNISLLYSSFNNSAVTASL